jgi:hypothetical protein
LSDFSTISLATAGAIFVTFLHCSPVPAWAQAPAGKAQTSSVPRLPNGKPDFNGVWDHPFVADMSKDAGTAQKGPGTIPLTPEYAQIFKDYDVAKFDYTGHCLPLGLTRSINSPMPIRIVQTNDLVVILYEAWNIFEIIHTDGLPHPGSDNHDPLWMGHPVGRWDGDTLVVDTTGFNTRTNLDTVGHPHSDALHTLERFTRTDDKHVAYEITIDDPKAYTRPWKNTRIFTLRPDWEIMEYSCEENNKEVNEGHIK